MTRLLYCPDLYARHQPFPGKMTIAVPEASALVCVIPTSPTKDLTIASNLSAGRCDECQIQDGDHGLVEFLGLRLRLGNASRNKNTH
jgi:hypothetical protein